MQKYNIAFITPEAVPFAKTGGLADISGVLPGNLNKLGHNVRMYMPLYRQVKSEFRNLTQTDRNLEIKIGSERFRADIYCLKDKSDGLNVYFVDNDFFFNRQELYREPSTGKDFADNDDRFIFFCKAVMEAIKRSDWKPDILHSNDWQSALIPVFLKTIYNEDPFFEKQVSVFTIHNLAYQGLFPSATFDKLGLDKSFFAATGPFEYYGKTNLMKSAINFADIITTVSPTYAREIQESNEYGMGLEGVLKERVDDLYGILNGIDYDVWSPKKDKLIPFNFFRDNLSGKKKNKLELLHRAEFPIRMEHPLIGMISRLDSQKGFDLLAEIIDDIMKLNLQFILLGTGEPKYHRLFTDISARYKDKFKVFLQFNNKLAHLIEAASDIFLMPSRYEPCGLNQMYSMIYGTIPIVRNTGGLADTVSDFNESTGEGTGFVFEEYESSELLDCIRKVVKLFGKKRKWYKMIKRGMDQDFSWDRSARKYVDIYRLARESN
jgi:starch synthase